MNILAVLTRDPTARKGGASYAINSSLALLSEKHHLSVTGYGDQFEGAHVAGYRSVGSLGRVVNNHVSFAWCVLRGRSYTRHKYTAAATQTKLNSFLAAGCFDCIWFEQAQAAFCVDAKCLQSLPSRPCLVLRSHNIEAKVTGFGVHASNAASSILLKLESTALARDEAALWRSMDAIAAISEEDCIAINRALSAESTNAIHLPVAGAALPGSVTQSQKCDPHTLLFIGDCTWRPNREAAEWIAKHLAPALGMWNREVQVTLAGHGTEGLTAGFAGGSIKGLGYVEDLTSLYQSSFSVLAPIQTGSGVNIKVLDALRHGVPVIGSRFGSRGINSAAYLVAESQEQYIKHLKNMHADSRYYRILKQSALAFCGDSERSARRALQSVLLTAKEARLRRFEKP
jgi:hypothetical protein